MWGDREEEEEGYGGEGEGEDRDALMFLCFVLNKAAPCRLGIRVSLRRCHGY